VNPEMVNPEMVNPEMVNPEMVNPEMVNPEMVNPEMVNPEMVNTDLVNGSLTDTTWTITNLGNTTSAYDVRLLLRNSTVPDGFKTQLILYKTYTTPVAKDCALREEAHNVLITSIPNPRLDPQGTSLPYDPADGSLQHATLWLAPGESARITLRVIDPDKTDDVTFEPIRDVTVSAKPQAVDSDDAASGVTDSTEVSSSPLVFLQAPHATPVGGLVTPTVQVLVQDETGSPIPGATVVLGLSWNPAGATLHNATATTDALGVARFPDLWLDRIGTGYRLQAAVGAVSSSATAPFDVVPLVVTRTDDNDISVFPPEPTIPGSLRAALENANRNVGYRDQISFAIPGVGPHTITLKHQAPPVTDPAVIDGTTQPGYAGTPWVRAECSSADCIHALWVQANDTTVRGLALTGAPGAGILVTNATGALLEHNYVGTDGTGDLGNGRGIDIVGGGTHTVRDNVVSGNDGTGIDILDSSGNVLRDNRIGTNASGTASVGNAQQGVRIGGSSSNNLVGGPGAGNVISGNVEGVGIYGPAHDNTVEGNRVGTSATGDAAIPNGVAGLHVSGGTGNTLIANLVSGNNGPGAATAVGVWLDSDATGNVVESNVIGLNAAQTAAMPNSGGGVSVHGTGTTANSLVANTISGNALRGVDFRFGAHDNALTDSHIGTDSSGTTAFGNEQDGVSVLDTAHSIAVGTTGHGNTVSGNGAHGVYLDATHTNVVLGNRIGTNSAGTSAIPNAGDGVNVAQSTLDRIGGAAAGEGNVISGNGGFGVYVMLAAGTTIEGNRIGVDASANTAVPNGAAGIAANDINTLTIGGTTAGAGNVVSGNVGTGVGISTASIATVQGNFIGTNGAGMVAIPNGGDGVHLEVAFHVAIGGSAAGAGNVISGQNGEGVVISNSQLNVVDGNLIGVNATGTGPLPNYGSGLRLLGGSGDNVIGGDATAAGNTVAFNGGSGIVDQANPGTGVVFGSNRIHSNALLGIDLADDGVTPNDSADLDAGPNDLLNFPVLTSATAAGSTTVTGTLNSVPGAAFVIQLFSSASCDPSGYGEGEVFEGWTTVTTGPGGDAGFTVTIGRSLFGRSVTATTSTSLAAGGATSEFSACIPVL
jgi:parallel beta-helix repeat protein